MGKKTLVALGVIIVAACVASTLRAGETNRAKWRGIRPIDPAETITCAVNYTPPAGDCEPNRTKWIGIRPTYPAVTIPISIPDGVPLLQDADGDTKVQVEESEDEDKIRFDTAGSEKMIIDDAGNVGIGTTVPWETLVVNGDFVVSNNSPRLTQRVDTNDLAFSWHLNADGDNDPWGVYQLWRGTDTGSGFAVDPAVPLLYFLNDNNLYSTRTGTFATLNATDEDNALQIDGTTILKTGAVADVNMLIGREAGDNLDNSGGGTDATKNVFIGAGAGKGGVSNTGKGNVAIGQNALNKVTSGSSNFALGTSALLNNTTGSSNVAIGISALQTNNQSTNVAIGTTAMLLCVNSFSNVAIGFNSGNGTAGQSFVRNVMIGYRTGRFLTNGSSNTFIGFESGGLTTSGDSNVFVGAKSGRNQTTNSNLLIIDNQDRGSAANELAESLIYGVFSDTVADQTLRFNAAVTTDGVIRGVTSLWYHEYHLGANQASPGNSGASKTELNAIFSWNLSAINHYLYYTVDSHNDWDAATDLEIEVIGYLGEAETADDLIEMSIRFDYGTDHDNANTFKTQTLDVDHDIDNSNAQYDVHKIDFTFNYDEEGNVLEVGDTIHLRIWLDDVTSVTDFNIMHVNIKYRSAHVRLEI